MSDDHGRPPAGDGALAVAEERAQELAALTAVQDDLVGVDRALAALDEGTYGTCEVCGGPIADEALAASPVARTCGAHDEPTTGGSAGH